MGITIEEAIKEMSEGVVILAPNGEKWQEARAVAIDTMRKYQKMQGVLDKIRAEIEQYQSDYDVHGTEYDRTAWKAFNRCLRILDKYKAESEE